MLISDIACETLDIYKFICYVFPMVDNELKSYINLAKNIPDTTLSKLALDSIYLKKFHCQGGCIYSLYPTADIKNMVHFIVAYQTISDYLDNLCDRAGIQEEAAFRNLHLAMNDALIPSNEYNDYYMFYPYKDDGGYLNKLVKECKTIIRYLPSYEVISDKIIYLSGLYSGLQVYKHLPVNIREDKTKAWYGKYIEYYPNVTGWEFAAASGSTLGIFVLVAAAFKKGLTYNEADEILKAYFPWICGLHILLDYYIDFYEDIKNHDLNFISYYKDMAEAEERIKYFYRYSIDFEKNLRYPYFHQMVIDGLLALYLSDAKAGIGDLQPVTQNIIKSGSTYAKELYRICKYLRGKGRV